MQPDQQGPMDQQLRAKREQWEQREPQVAPAQRERPARRVRKVRQESLEPLDPAERRANGVQLARLAVPDLLGLLGLPVPKERQELRGRPVRPDHLGQQVRRVQPDIP